MKKHTIACVFAHPDDESFGPSGTLIKLAQQGHNVYVITATKGQAGQSSDKKIIGDLGSHRAQELTKACKIMGINPPLLLDFFDGTLNEHQLPLLKKSILEQLSNIKPDVIIIYERGGISYHLDHIAVTKAMLSIHDEKLYKAKKLYYFGLPSSLSKEMGRESTLDDSKLAIINVSDVMDLKIKAMQAHESQEKDFIRIIKRLKDMSKGEYLEYFSLARSDIKSLSFPESDLLNGL
jgi:LmbE family N-acetylglucosaminyl deacetylase